MVGSDEMMMQKESLPESSYIAKYRKAIIISFIYSQVSFWRQ